MAADGRKHLRLAYRGRRARRLRAGVGSPSPDGPERGTADRQHIEQTFEKQGLSINVVFETSSYTLINEAVQNGAGIAIVNAFWPRPETANGWRTINLSHLFGKKRIGLFRRNDVYLPPYAGDYLAMLRETLMT